MTTATLYVSRNKSPSGASDPHCSHAVQLTLWRDDSAAATIPQQSQSLCCFSFLDHPTAYNHLQALLDRDQSLPETKITCLHVAAEKQVNQRALAALERVVREALHNNNVDDDDNVTMRDNDDPGHGPPPLDMTIRFHESLPAHSSRKSSLSQQTLSRRLSKKAALAVGAHSDLSALLHSTDATPLSIGLDLFVRVTGAEHLTTNLEILLGKVPSCLALDRTAADAIHLWPPPQCAADTAANHSSSLFGLLRHPLKTTAGQARLATWLQQPLVEYEQILERQDAVAWLLQPTNGVGRDALQQEGLAGFASVDLDALASQLELYSKSADMDVAGHDEDENGMTTTTAGPLGSTTKALQALYRLWLVSSQKLPLLRDRLEIALSEDSSPDPDASMSPRPTLLVALLNGLAQAEQSLIVASQLAEDVLDMGAAPREYRLRPGYKPELEQVHDDLVELEEQVQECLDQMNYEWASVSGKQGAVRLERNNNDGVFQFRLADANDLKLLQATTHLSAQVSRILKNGVYFTTKALAELASKKQDLQAEYDKYQRDIAMQAMQAAATYADVLFNTSQLVATLDVIVGLAHVAAYHNYVRPELTDDDENGHGIILKAARHPCVELQESVDYIPNDMRLVFGEASFLLITGPNMGGKSTYIRSLGAIVALAQIGSYVPCSAAKINICHDILARVGAGDLQERGISTFMAEMLESSSILRRATKRSLIIIDELGRGTSTYDGYGLARAISEYIVDTIGCMTVFTTHFHELTTLEDHKHVVKNYHVTAKKGERGLTFLYEVRPGPCLESFGIQVAKMANVPSVVIEDAKIKAKELENFEYKSFRPNASIDSPSSVADDGYAVDDHDDAESAAADIAFVKRLRQIDLKALLSKEYASDADKKAAVFRALESEAD